MGKQKLKYLVIHCTATPEGRDVSAADIRRMHTSPKPQGRGWRQVGYTDLFRLDGTRERLVKNNEDAYVDGWEVTNGAAGFNSVSRHIVYAGGVAKDGKTPQDTRTPAQRSAMAEYVQDFHRRHPDVKIIGHRNLSPDRNGNGKVEPNEWTKACPSFEVSEWLESIGIKQ